MQRDPESTEGPATTMSCDVSSTLTSAFPYARLAFGDRLFTWGVLGYGTGELGVAGAVETAHPDRRASQ